MLTVVIAAGCRALMHASWMVAAVAEPDGSCCGPLEGRPFRLHWTARQCAEKASRPPKRFARSRTKAVSADRPPMRLHVGAWQAPNRL